MRKIRFIAIAALAAFMMSCGSKPYDAGKVSDLTDRMFSLTPEDYPEVVKQLDGILYGMDGQMDEATKKAYDEFQKRRTAFRGF